MTNHSPGYDLAAVGSNTLTVLCRLFAAVSHPQNILLFRVILFNFLLKTKVKMVKTAKEKTIHKAMRSADKFYSEVPGGLFLKAFFIFLLLM